MAAPEGPARPDNAHSRIMLRPHDGQTNVRVNPGSWPWELSALSKTLEEGKQGVGGFISSGRKAARLGVCERAFLELQVGMLAYLCRL